MRKGFSEFLPKEIWRGIEGYEFRVHDFLNSFRVSIQPTSTQSTSSFSSNSVQRPLHIDNVEPSRSSTFIATVRPTRLPETVTNDSATVKRPGRPGRPVFLQPSKDADTSSLEVEPTQFLTSVNPVETAATTNSPTKTRVVWPSKISTRTRDSEIKTTVSQPTEDLPKLSNTTTEVNCRTRMSLRT